MIEAANSEVDSIQNQYLQGHITQEERYNRVVEVWSKTNEELTNVMMKNLKEDRDGFNPVYMMANSGARGSRSQIRQLAGMRGLMAKPSGDIIELPIRSNFKEGLSVIEFFISTNGARKGLADTALKTADAGYLTRRLVDIAQDVVVNEDDCGTINGIDMTAIKDGEEIVESLSDRIVGRYTLERVKHPITGEVIVDVNEEITDEIGRAIEEGRASNRCGSARCSPARPARRLPEVLRRNLANNRRLRSVRRSASSPPSPSDSRVPS
jgi:DNA-directed RNA polymerase subunit beta'